MTRLSIGLLLTCAVLLAACAGERGTRYRPPSEDDLRPQGAIDDGVPAAACLLKPFAGADGILSSAELDAAITATFTEADVNHDGWLDKAETQKLNAARAGSCDRSPLIDWRGSGLIGINDYAARYRTAFARADVNGDGNLTAAELAAQRQFRKPPREGMAPPQPPQ